MAEKIKKSEKRNNEKGSYEFVRIPKSTVIAETKSGILINFYNKKEHLELWFAKQYCRNNEYGLFFTVSINTENAYEINVVDSDDGYSFKGLELAETFKEIFNELNNI